jgi:hypothetical protein
MDISHFRDTPNVVLDTSNPVAVPLGEPVAVASTTSVERSEDRGMGMHARALAPADRAAGVLSFRGWALHLHA